MTTAQRWRVLFAGYGVVVAFAIALLAVHAVGRNLDWGSLSPLGAVAIAAVFAAPVALAFTWDRISRVKFFDVEIALNDVAAETSARLAAEVQDTQRQA